MPMRKLKGTVLLGTALVIAAAIGMTAAHGLADDDWEAVPEFFVGEHRGPAAGTGRHAACASIASQHRAHRTADGGRRRKRDVSMR
jgi:hypothetical protein